MDHPLAYIEKYLRDIQTLVRGWGLHTLVRFLSLTNTCTGLGWAVHPLQNIQADLILFERKLLCYYPFAISVEGKFGSNAGTFSKFPMTRK